MGLTGSRHKEESSSSDEDLRAAKQSSPILQCEPGLPSGGVSYKKTLRLTSEQLVRTTSLELIIFLPASCFIALLSCRPPTSHSRACSCLFSCWTALTTLCSAWPLSIREPVDVREPSTSGTGMTRSSSPTSMEPSPGVGYARLLGQLLQIWT